MLQSFIIMLRETLEAALVVGIVLSYLRRSNHEKHRFLVHFAVLAGIAVSMIGAWIFNRLAGGFSGKSEELFEGITMLVGAFLLTTMILWMMNQSSVAREIEKKVKSEISRSRKFGLFFLVFVSVLREGIESVIFLGAVRFSSAENNLLGASLGIAAAVLLGYLFLKGSIRLRLSTFFAITNVLLILFAAGLVAHGLHELQEAGVIPIIVEHVWNLNPAVMSQANYPLLHESGYIGSIAKGLFGYNGNPSLLEVITYVLYLTAAGAVWMRINKRRV